MQEPMHEFTDGAVGALSHEQRAECWYKLGVMHAKKEGCGSLCSNERAAKWWAMAAAQGHAGAHFELGEIHSMRAYGSPGRLKIGGGQLWEQYALSAAHFKNGSDLGHAAATERLGYAYENGLGVEVSYTKARWMYSKAHHELGGTELTVKRLVSSV